MKRYDTAQCRVLSVREIAADTFDLTVDAGMGSLGQSTVVDCHDDELNIVRQGDAELQ